MIAEDAFSAEARQIVHLKDFASFAEAEIVKGLLNSQGIPVENSGCALYVRREDLEDAQGIIDPAGDQEYGLP